MDDGKFYVSTTIPDGRYQGKWGGYVIDFPFADQTVSVRTQRGVRGMDIPVDFSVVDGRLVDDSIEVIK